MLDRHPVDTVTEKLGTITQVYSDGPRPRGLHRRRRRRPDQRRGARQRGDAQRSRCCTFLLLVAGLNLFVGVFNLLPLLPLDGGHIAVLAVRAGARQDQAACAATPASCCGSTSPSCCRSPTRWSLFFAGFTVWLLGADIVNPIRIS